MLTKFTIHNYKSIVDQTLELGRVNLFIGENGAGKSNVLEGVGLACAALANKLNHEFLAARGIRVCPAQWMRSAFATANQSMPIELGLVMDGKTTQLQLQHDNQPYAQWAASPLKLADTKVDGKSYEQHKANDESEMIGAGLAVGALGALRHPILGILGGLLAANANHPKNAQKMLQAIDRLNAYCDNFVIYSPEASSLREFQRSGQVEPLGVNGEGLLKLLQVLQQTDPACLQAIQKKMEILGWFDGFTLKPEHAGPGLLIRDQYVSAVGANLDQSSANEGFFFLLFYFTLFASKLTPGFFAVDNIDASLNPKLCEALMRKLVELAKQEKKQVLLSGHNPALLDGLNLEDDEQRLFVVERDIEGHTRVRRVSKPQAGPGQIPSRLSELFMRGAIGGLPKGF